MTPDREGRDALVKRFGFWIDGDTLRESGGGCRTATDAEIAMFAALSQPAGEQEAVALETQDELEAADETIRTLRAELRDRAAIITSLQSKRRLALEEAAKVCDALSDKNDISQSEASAMGLSESAQYHNGARKELVKAAAAIRALANGSQQPGREATPSDVVTVPSYIMLDAALAGAKDKP